MGGVFSGLILLMTAVTTTGPATPAASARVPAAVGAAVAADLVSEQPVRSWQLRDIQPPADSSLPDWDVLVWDFAELNGVMYVGGRFQTVRKYSGATEYAQPFLAAFDVGTGQWISSFRPQLDDGVYALAASPGGTHLLVGGEFTNVNGAPLTSGFAALDPFTGEPDPNWTASVTREEGEFIVKDIDVYGNDVYLGGRFSHIESHRPNSRTRRYSIARLDGATGELDQDWNLPVNGGRVMALALSPDGSEIYAGGFFTAMGQMEGTKWMAKASTVDATVTPLPEPPPPDGKYYVFDLAVSEQKIFAGTEWHRLFVWDRATLARTNSWHSNGYGGDYQALHVEGDVVWAGGHHHGWEQDRDNLGDRRLVQWLSPFHAAAGTPVDGWVARLGMTDGIFAITSDSQGKIWVGGDPTSGGTVPAGGFAVFPRPSADDDINLARSRPATQSTSGELGPLFRGRSSEERCNDALNPTLVGPAGNAVDGKTAGGPWECSVATTAAETNPWWQVDLGESGQIDMMRLWNMTSTPVKDELADVWIAIADDPAAIDSTDPVALAANPDVTLRQIPGPLSWFHEEPIGVYGQHVRVFLDSDTPVQLRLPEVEVLDLAGIEPPPVVVDNGTTLVAAGAEWRFSDDGTDPGGTWTEAAFDDGGWSNGAAPLGFGDDDLATVTQSGSTTTYLRHSFDIADPAAVPGLILSVMADDGAVVHINGAERYRIRMPAGPIGPNTGASDTVWGAAERTWATVEIAAADLVAGTNVIAIEAHNNWSGGGDLAIDASLVATEDVIVEQPVDQQLVSFDASWRYLDTGVDPGADWVTPAFDDDSWPLGTAEFGYGDGDEVTVIAEGPVPDRHITTWFRTVFDVAEPNDISGLSIGLLRDDGAAVYVNGVELVRDNLPAGPLTAETRAETYAWGPGESEPHYFSVPADALVAGENVVAVEVHSTDPGSKDLSFALEVIGIAP